ncbi:isoaspartyl peptidase/L-asparaginase, partial [Campylobacter upsaliensis]|nr:isoaspartyl peptidase/L-asparaginase [Campylobacter upsaliensis]
MNLVKGGKKALLVMASLAFLSSVNLYAKDFKPVIVIHGGTSGLGLTKEEFAKREVVMKESLKAGQKILEAGGS